MKDGFFEGWHGNRSDESEDWRCGVGRAVW